MNLEYGYIWPNTRVLGPGDRFVIWVQGCHRRCFRCTSPELQIFDNGRTIDTDVLVDKICHTHNISGITISGGEPFEQSAALADLLIKLKALRPVLTVILFTGYRLDQLKNEEYRKVLEHVDVLIDGEYIDALNDNKGLRGSSNQTIHFLTSRLIQYKDILENADRTREIHVLAENELLTIGIANRNK